MTVPLALKENQLLAYTDSFPLYSTNKFEVSRGKEKFVVSHSWPVPLVVFASTKGVLVPFDRCVLVWC